MELPFAVEPSDPSLQEASGRRRVEEDDASSLVTASSQGSFLQSEDGSFGHLTSSPVASSPARQHQPTTTTFDHQRINLIRDEVLAPHHSSTVGGGYTYSPSQQSTSSKLVAAASNTLTSSLAATSSRVASVFSNLTATKSSSTVPTASGDGSRKTARGHHPVDTLDVNSYVNVWETDDDEVEIVLPDGGSEDPSNKPIYRGDILSLLLNQSVDDSLIVDLERANHFMAGAAQAKQRGQLQQALDQHTAAANIFYQVAVASKEHHGEFLYIKAVLRSPYCPTKTVMASNYCFLWPLCSASMAESLLLLSQTQAKSASALKRVVKLRPTSISSLLQQSVGTSDRLRAKVRESLDNQPGADLSESTFLGQTGGIPDAFEEANGGSVKDNQHSTKMTTDGVTTASPTVNPVDEMMALERELRDMDMKLELGSSIASLDARGHNRPKTMDGSFMVVAPGSQSYMSSSAMWSPPPQAISHPPRNPSTSVTATAGARARANRVQLSTSRAHLSSAGVSHKQSQQQNGLESSWWDSTASQALTSSVASLAGSVAHHDGFGAGQLHLNHQHPANSKQLMRLMDSLKTLGDENASLLRQVEEAEAARIEAKMAQEEMRRFKEEYNRRFNGLREVLERFRKDYPGGNDSNPLVGSEYAKSTPTTDQLQRQQQLIRKLTADLKKEKSEGKKKDAALTKYENFYREVKARSAQKAAQRQKDAGNRRNKVSRR